MGEASRLERRKRKKSEDLSVFTAACVKLWPAPFFMLLSHNQADTFWLGSLCHRAVRRWEELERMEMKESRKLRIESSLQSSHIFFSQYHLYVFIIFSVQPVILPPTYETNNKKRKKVMHERQTLSPHGDNRFLLFCRLDLSTRNWLV